MQGFHEREITMKMRRYIILMTLSYFGSAAEVFSQYTNIPLSVGGNQYETTIAISPRDTNRLLAVWSDHLVSSEGYSYSTDGGRSWASRG